MKTKTALFTMRLSYSGRAAHRAFLTQGQEAFLEGHVSAFERMGGVRWTRSATTTSTARSNRCCSDTPGGERALDLVSIALWFEAWYCQPGPDGSHEKGGVEGEGGRFRAITACPCR